MDSSDQLTLQDLADTRSVVAKMRRRSLVAAGLGGIIFSATVAAFWIWHRPSQPGIAVFLAVASFCAVGYPAAASLDSPLEKSWFSAIFSGAAAQVWWCCVRLAGH